MEEDIKIIDFTNGWAAIYFRKDRLMATACENEYHGKKLLDFIKKDGGRPMAVISEIGMLYLYEEFTGGLISDPGNVVNFIQEKLNINILSAVIK